MPLAKEQLPTAPTPSTVEQVNGRSSRMVGGSCDLWNRPHPSPRAGPCTQWAPVSLSVWRPRAGLWTQTAWVESQLSRLWAVWPTASDLTFLGPHFLAGTTRAEITPPENEGASGRPAPCLGVHFCVYSADDAITRTVSQHRASRRRGQTEYGSFPS